MLIVTHLRPPFPTTHLRPPFPITHLRPPFPTTHLRPPFPFTHLRPPFPTTHLRPPVPITHLRPPFPILLLSALPSPNAHTQCQAPMVSHKESHPATSECPSISISRYTPGIQSPITLISPVSPKCQVDVRRKKEDQVLIGVLGMVLSVEDGVFCIPKPYSNPRCVVCDGVSYSFDFRLQLV